ncbi:hypothetical protein [Mycolicibacterium mageritense]|uniref:hypothetical protein n=1 Tax=Mycolicibacterium mageritense TaxID=53462 RepID=UPI001E31D5A4|nr:hypothetical protein [Mycolicibacterium mageritense]GJJ17123.1 hypothetical protein MTY414_07960 [Mycolicibacterium mageritense]
MTAFVTRSDPQPDVVAGPADALLRFALRADATVCAGVGLLTAMTADALARISGLSATAGWLIGAALVGYGVLLYGLARIPDIRRVGVSVLSGNMLFAVAAVVAVAGGWLPVTAAGTDLLLGFVVATLGLAWLQFRGVRRLV